MGVIKKKPTEKLKVRKRILKEEVRSNGRVSVRSSDASGSGSDNFMEITRESFEDNREGDPVQMNDGFEVQPLCPKTVGYELAR